MENGKLEFFLLDGKTTSTSDSDFFFGYTYFQQLKDPTNPRGFSQKSVVILTSLPFVEFYKNIVDLLGQTYFESYWSDADQTKDFLKVREGTGKMTKIFNRKTMNISRIIGKSFNLVQQIKSIFVDNVLRYFENIFDNFLTLPQRSLFQNESLNQGILTQRAKCSVLMIQTSKKPNLLKQKIP